MLMPKKVKHRKMHRGRMSGLAMRGNTIDFGDYAIMALECGWITSRQIESARIAMTRHIKRGGRVFIRIFPQKSYTKKPLEQRMGKGKAPLEGWVAVIKPGRIMFEIQGVPYEIAKEAMRLAIHKLPIRCKFVSKMDFADGHPIDSLTSQVTARKGEGWEARAVAEAQEALKIKTLKALSADQIAALEAAEAEADAAAMAEAEALNAEENAE